MSSHAKAWFDPVRVERESSRCSTEDGRAYLLVLGRHLRKVWLLCFLLASAGFLVRLPALQGQLIWDDQFLAHDNPFIKSPLLILESFRHYLFLDSFSGHYRPVQNISFVVDYFFWNTDTCGFHLTNILLHVFSGVLLFLLLRRLCADLWGKQTIAAWLVAFLWIVHPVHSAAIDYISGRADSLAFLFACGAWLLALRARRCEHCGLCIAFYSSAAVLGLLALCSREIALVWIGLFILHRLFFENSVSRRAKIVTSVCCLLLLSSYAGLRQLPDRRAEPGPSSDWNMTTRAVLMLRALGDYGRLMIFPTNLHMERTLVDGENYRDVRTWEGSVRTEYLSVLGLVVLGGMICGCCRNGPGKPLRIFGAVWFGLAYLPVSNLVELNATVAEHWLYLPSVGFLLFLAGCAAELPIRARSTFKVCAGLAIVALSARSFIRSTDWVNPETFYQRTIAAGGTSTRISVNLAQIYTARGEYPQAERIYRNVLRILPDYPIARNNLADILYRQGRAEEAGKMFVTANRVAMEARKEYPRTWIAALNLARLRYHEQDQTAALSILEQARIDYPHIWEIIGLQSEILRVTQGPESALHAVEDFARKNWWHYGASLALGRLYAEKGDVERAVAALTHASRLDVHDTAALNLIAFMSVNGNQLEKAIAVQRRAVGRQPDEPRQYRFLSDILLKMGRGAEAELAMAKIDRLEAVARADFATN